MELVEKAKKGTSEFLRTVYARLVEVDFFGAGSTEKYPAQIGRGRIVAG